MPQMDIGTVFDIDARTLRKHFTRALEMGSFEATTKMAGSLFRMTTEGRNLAAAVLWMKARAGWREKPVEALEDKSLDQLTDEELETLIRRARDDGALPTSHMTIQRIIVDPKAPGPVINGRPHDVGPD